MVNPARLADADPNKTKSSAKPFVLWVKFPDSQWAFGRCWWWFTEDHGQPQPPNHKHHNLKTESRETHGPWPPWRTKPGGPVSGPIYRAVWDSPWPFLIVRISGYIIWIKIVCRCLYRKDVPMDMISPQKMPNKPNADTDPKPHYHFKMSLIFCFLGYGWVCVSFWQKLETWGCSSFL